MDKVGILAICYGSRGTAIIDTFCRSQKYAVEVYIVDVNRNPFNIEKAKRHIVIPDLDVKKITKFAEKYQNKIDLGIVGPEKPIIAGIRDILEKETSIPMICPTQKYAIEGSKIAQRLLFQEIKADVNPQFKLFDPHHYTNLTDVKNDLWKWLDTFNDQVAVKPDGTTAGKGVGIWGDHFTNRQDLFQHFLSNYKHGPVIVEEKLFGEESSFQAFCDGKNIVPLPETRDYKRAFEGNQGPNTGGMGSYKAASDWLPFMTSQDRAKEIDVVKSMFKRLKGKGSNPGLRGIPFYVAFMHTREGLKILENNSRPGDPEIMNILPILKDDFIDVCFQMIEGNLKRINFEKLATVVTYKVPPTYGGRVKEFRGDKQIQLNAAYKLGEESQGRLWIYPGAMELREGKTFELKSRTVSVVGVAKNMETAREISLEGINAIKGGSLWYRKDIASKGDIQKSIEHMEKLRTE
jgi:phosphoribosylamine--glycine ligase